jgi:hypothetical protein
MLSLKKIGSGKYSDIFSVNSETENFAMKVSYYRDETVRRFIQKISGGDDAGAKKEKDSDAVSISSRFSKIARQLKNMHITPHFLELYNSRDVKNFVEKIPILSARLKDLTPLQRKYNHVSFMELFDTDMTAFLTKMLYDDDFLRIVIFQVLYSISSVQRMIPGWRHNDLSTNNILTKKTERISSRYRVDGKYYYTSTDNTIAIIDYDFVNADVEKLHNQRVHSGHFKVFPDKNVSYDSHFFLKSVFKCITRAVSSKNVGITIEFLKGLQLQHSDRHDVEIEDLDPLKIIKHSYFDKLLTEIPFDNKFVLPTNNEIS